MCPRCLTSLTNITNSVLHIARRRFRLSCQPYSQLAVAQTNEPSSLACVMSRSHWCAVKGSHTTVSTCLCPPSYSKLKGDWLVSLFTDSHLKKKKLVVLKMKNLLSVWVLSFTNTPSWANEKSHFFVFWWLKQARHDFTLSERSGHTTKYISFTFLHVYKEKYSVKEHPVSAILNQQCLGFRFRRVCGNWHQTGFYYREEAES